MRLLAGLDWGNSGHALCVVDEQGKVLLRLEVAHDGAGLTELRAQLAKLCPSAEIPIAIERPTGLLVDTRVEAGHVVVPIHPNVVKACRPRYRAVASKNDLGDAYLLADVLRTDGPRFRALTPQSDALKALRARVRTREDLVAERVALANPLRALLESFWPGAAALFADIDSPIALAFVQHDPTPQSASQLGPKRLASLLAQHPYSGRRCATELLERMRKAPVGLARDAEANAKGQLVVALARVLCTLVTELGKLTRNIEHEVAQLADGRIVMSFPRAGRLNAAQLLSELGDVRERFASEEQLAAEAGVCPVTYESGKSRGVGFRWACNKRLRRASTTWASNSVRASPWAAEL
jgi:transposase